MNELEPRAEMERREETPFRDLEARLPPEIREALPPWARKLAYVLDDLIKIPGLDRGVGLDALVGLLVPGAGDAITALGSTALLLLALKRRVPFVILARMVMNIGVDALLGTVPVLGDAFDVFFRSNRRNLELIEAHQGAGSPPSAKDYAIVGLGFGLAVMSVVLPVALAITLGVKIAEWTAGY